MRSIVHILPRSRTIVHNTSHIMADQAPRSRVLEHVGQNLRRLRKEANMSQEALAEASGISRRMIINVEAGDTNISLTSLDRLVEALNTTFGHMVRDPNQETKRVQALVWQGDHPDSHATLRDSVPAQKEAQLLEMTLGPGDSYPGEPDPEGWHEMIMVHVGELQIELESGPLRVVAGGFATYSTAQHFTYRNLSADSAHFWRVVIS